MNINKLRAKHRLLKAPCTTALLVGLASLSAMTPACASAQERQSDSQSQAKPNDGFVDIIVTARRVEESGQKVPVTLSAYTGETLKEKTVVDVTSFTKNIPGVNACCAVFNTALNTFVRGINNGAPTYFGDVPVSPEGYDNYFDLANAQVLKGPQGTLFGQASNAGAFVFQPRKPGAQLGGYVSAVTGNYGRRTVEGAVDIPLVTDKVLFRLAGISAYRRGYVHNLSNNTWIGDEDYWIVRPSLTVKLTDNLENYTLYQHSYAQTTGETGLITVLDDFNFNPTQNSQNGLMVLLNGGNQAAYDALRVQALLRQRALGPYAIDGHSVGCQNNGRNINVGFGSPLTSIPYADVSCPKDYFSQDRFINSTALQLGNWTVKNTFGYSSGKSYQGPADIDGTQLVILDYRSAAQKTAIPTPSRTSDELQLRGKAGIFDITGGFFYYHQSQDTGIVYSDFDLIALSAQQTIASQTSKAIFGQTTVHLDRWLPGLTFTGGMRYTWDDLNSTIKAFNPATLALISTTGGPGTPAGEAHYGNLSYTAGLQYQITPQTMLFFTNSRGFSSGGFQNVVGFEKYTPSVLTNFEGGIKSTFNIGSMRARLNLTGFYGNFDNIQVNVFQPVTNAAGQTTFVSVVKNAAKARMKGLEGEFDILPFDGLQLGGFFAYLDNKYTSWPSFDGAGNPIDLSSTPFLFAPKWKVGIHGNYRLPLPESIGKVKLGADFTHRSIMVNTSVPLKPTDPNNPMSGQVCSRAHTVANGYPAAVADGRISYIDCDPGYGNLDLSLSWDEFLGNKNLSLMFTVTNVTKNTIADSGANLRAQGMSSPTPAIPRMWSLRANYKF